MILDTNVVSEIMRPEPEPSVLRWLARHNVTQYATTVVTEAELRAGQRVLPIGRRSQALLAVIERTLGSLRVLTLESPAARHYATIVCDRRSMGRPIEPMDALIAAISLQHGLALVTRNVRDFEGCGIVVINPWSP